MSADNVPDTTPCPSDLLFKYEGDRERMKNESERGCVLVAAALFDEVLRGLLKARFHTDGFLSKKDIEFLLGDGIMPPLRPFALRIMFCRAFNLINDDQRKALEALRNIRNHFSHFSGDVAIDLEMLKPVVAGLPDDMRLKLERITRAIDLSPAEMRKSYFQLSISYHLGYLHARLRKLEEGTTK